MSGFILNLFIARCVLYKTISPLEFVWGCVLLTIHYGWVTPNYCWTKSKAMLLSWWMRINILIITNSYSCSNNRIQVSTRVKNSYYTTWYIGFSSIFMTNKNTWRTVCLPYSLKSANSWLSTVFSTSDSQNPSLTHL